VSNYSGHLLEYKMTTYTGASVSGWSWGTTWTASDEANDDEEDGESFRVRFTTVQRSVNYYILRFPRVQGYDTGRDCLLLLLDCSSAMFESSGEEETPFELCIRVSGNHD